MKFKGKKAIMAAALSAIVAAGSFSTVATAENSKTYWVLYDINRSDLGDVSLSNRQPVAGEKVTVTVTPKAGGEIAELYVRDTKDPTIIIPLNGNSFIMPANDVVLYCRFQPVSSKPTTWYRISYDIDGSEFGDVSVNSVLAVAGETVTINAVPKEGYEIAELYVRDIDNPTIIVPLNGNSFTMPASAVVIYCRFQPTAKPEPTPTPAPTPTPTHTGKKGDANCDGRVNAEDATAILKHTVGTEPLTEQGMKNADMDDNGKITAADATAILKLLVNQR